MNPTGLLALRPELRVFPEPHGVVFFDRNPYQAHKRYTLKPALAFLLCLFDGRRTADQVAQILASTLSSSLSDARRKVQDAIRVFCGQLLVPAEERDRRWMALGASPPPLEDLLFRPSPDLPRRARHPYSLVYLVTQRCFRRCVYCYADAGPGPGDESGTTLSGRRIRSLIKEAGALGVAVISLTGGDPLVDPRTVDFALGMMDGGILPWISTKGRLSTRNAERLAQSGLPLLQVSIDSHKPETQDALCDVRGSFVDILGTIDACLQAGIRVYTNTVVTAWNIEDVPYPVRDLRRRGVTACLLTPYTRSLGRHDDALFATREQWMSLLDWYTEYVENGGAQLRFTKALDPELARRSGETLLERQKGRSDCTAGREGFCFLSDGDVVLCERLATFRRERPEVVVGNLAEQGIGDVWDSPTLDKMVFPTRSAFDGTVCSNCEEFEDCGRTRGRCYVRCLMAYGRLFGPDPLCHLAPATQERFM